MTKLRTILAVTAILLVAGAAAIYVFPRPALAQGQNATVLTSVSCDCQEASFGDLTTDALQAAGGADIAFVAAISLRPGALPPGSLTKDRVVTLLANPDEVWAVSRLTGAQVRGALELAVRAWPLPNNAFLQVAGLSFDYSASAPALSRVKAVRVGAGTLSDQATYTVAMPLSLAKGGSGFFKVFTKEAIIRQGTSSLADTIVSYAAGQGSVTYTGVGRIVALP
jgi:5'-nucleotidase